MIKRTRYELLGNWSKDESYKDFLLRIKQDKKVWVDLESLKKDIEELYNIDTLQDRFVVNDQISAYIKALQDILNLCGSSPVHFFECRCGELVSDTSGEEVCSKCGSLVKYTSSPVHNQKKCTCNPKPRRGGMGVEVICGRCGGAL